MDTYVLLSFYSMIVALFIGGFGTVMSRRYPHITNRISYIFASIGSLFGIITALLSLMKIETLFILNWQMTAHISFRFAIDELSAFFLLLISVIGFIVSIYSPAYVRKFIGKKVSIYWDLATICFSFQW